KKKVYAKFGVAEYWLTDPETCTIEVLVLSEQGYISAGVYSRSERLSSPLLPRLDLPFSEIFG
ncbi:MAG TPA: Uma2 family endonuclease, partial [Acidobacteriota bacterium]|nr:Uma2 family endonuclease [Acidobacteriota bacterium]